LKLMCACVAEQQKHLTVNQADDGPSWVRVLPHAPVTFRDVGLTGKPSVSKIEVLSSNLSVLANLSTACSSGWVIQILWKGSLTGKAVVLKTTAHSRLQVRLLSLLPRLFPIANCRLPISMASAMFQRNPKAKDLRPKTQSAIGNWQLKCWEASPNGMAAVC
jgi:hypothetical protein